MLETLDSVPWNELGHAYGEATDVPDLIRTLASPEPEVVKNAMSHLWSSVIHQGTVYSSTASVVPFFCELLETPDVQNKTELLDYLATIARGASYHDVHVHEKERRETPEMQKEIAKELSWVQAASDAVSDGFATYLCLLQSPDAQLRASAAHVLCRCQSHTLEVVPAMKQHFFAEKTVLVRASLLLSLGSILEKDGETMFFFGSVLQSAHPGRGCPTARSSVSRKGVVSSPDLELPGAGPAQPGGHRACHEAAWLACLRDQSANRCSGTGRGGRSLSR